MSQFVQMFVMVVLLLTHRISGKEAQLWCDGLFYKLLLVAQCTAVVVEFLSYFDSSFVTFVRGISE